MIGVSFEQRISDSALTADEYYLASVMFSMGFMRHDDEKKFSIMSMLRDPETEQEKEVQQKHFKKCYEDDFVPKETFWVEEENSPIGASQIRHLFIIMQREVIGKNWTEQPIAKNDLFQRLMKIDVVIMDISDAREQLSRMAKELSWGSESSALSSLFREPEAFRKPKGNFASMDRKRFYRQTGVAKHARMQHKNFRRKM